MSARKRRPIAREEGQLRDTTLFIIACEDTCAPEQYFAGLGHSSRLKVKVLPSEDGRSAPEHLKTRLQAYKDEYDVGDQDQLWLMFDEDHHFAGQHTKSTMQALREAENLGAQMALSNPSFEVWLLLHHDDLATQSEFANASAAEKALRDKLGGYNKSRLNPENFSPSSVLDAVSRAEKLDTGTDKYRPKNPGSRVYKLMQELLKLGLLRGF